MFFMMWAVGFLALMYVAYLLFFKKKESKEPTKGE